MSINIRITLYTSKLLSDGTHPIVIWLSRNKERKHYSSGYSVTLKDWNPKERCVKSKHPLASKINSDISALKAKYDHSLIELQKFTNGEFQLSDIHNRATDKVKPRSVFNYFDEVIIRLRNSGKVGNSKAYDETRRVFKNFCNGKDALFSELTPSRLERFKEYLDGRGVGDVTKHFYFRQLRALFNRAITDGMASQKDYPFRKFRLSQFNTSTGKRALSKDDIHQIINAEIADDKPIIYQLARDYFRFAYYSGGINFVDFSLLKWTDINKNHATYKRSKTGQLITFPINRVRDILAYYELERNKSGFVFPVLNEFHNTPIRIHNRVQKVRGQVNKALRKIGNELGINGVTTYVARHSAASIMRDSGVSVSAISKTLGHTNLSTTEIYLSQLSQEVIDEALEKL